MLGGRSAGFVARQALEPANYRSLIRLPRVCLQPARFARMYFLGAGTYPTTCSVRTPLGVVSPTVYSHHDVFTVNEIFCRGDYEVPPGTSVVVDVGANIGISALYFLTRGPDVRVHLYEPDPRNAERARANLADFEGRWTLHEEAVADRAGIVAFGREDTGRYGGVGLASADQIEVPCRHINDVLREVLAQEPRIDALKIDTEGLEDATVAAIEPSLMRGLRLVCFETRAPFNPAPDHFAMRSSSFHCRLTARAT